MRRIDVIPVATGIMLIIFITAAAIVIFRNAEDSLQYETATPEGYVHHKSGPEVTDFNYWVSIKTDHWWRFAYEIVIRNDSDATEVIRADIRYIDAGGIIVDSTSTNYVTIPAGDKTTVRGHSLISASAAKNIEDAEIDISITK